MQENRSDLHRDVCDDGKRGWFGSTMRQASSFSSKSRSSAYANKENWEEARSREDGGANDLRNPSITRSEPVFLTSFIAERFLI